MHKNYLESLNEIFLNINSNCVSKKHESIYTTKVNILHILRALALGSDCKIN